MPVIKVSAQAAQELAEAAAWYEQEQAGLGVKLLDEFEHALELLGEEFAPLVPVPGEAARLGAKRLLLHRFPFSIVTIERDDQLIIVAVAHQSRKPGYWRERVQT